MDTRIGQVKHVVSAANGGISSSYTDLQNFCNKGGGTHRPTPGPAFQVRCRYPLDNDEY